jgi:hypothetical protein
MVAGFYHEGYEDPLLMLMRRRTVHAGLVVKVSSIQWYCFIIFFSENSLMCPWINWKSIWVWILLDRKFWLQLIPFHFPLSSRRNANAISKYYCSQFIDCYPAKSIRQLYVACRVRKVRFPWQPRKDQPMHQKDSLLTTVQGFGHQAA